MAQITFHSMADSAYLWTAMHVADEKGVSYDVAPLVYGSSEHLRLHPFGKMPVMQHNRLFLYETLAIAHYIDRAFDGPPMQPADAAGQAEVLRWVSIVNAYVFPVMNRFMKERLVRPAWGVDPNHEFLDQAREPLALQVRLINEATGSAEFLAGDRLTIADSFLLPNFLFFSLTPEGAALLADAPCASAWLRRMKARASYVNSPMNQVFDAFDRLPAPTQAVWPSASAEMAMVVDAVVRQPFSTI
jgi:glutathione S-transferase